MSRVRAQLLVFEFIYRNDRRFRVCDLYPTLALASCRSQKPEAIPTHDKQPPSQILNVYNGSYFADCHWLLAPESQRCPYIPRRAILIRVRLLRVIMQHAPSRHHHYHHRRGHHNQRYPLLALCPLAQKQGRETQSDNAATARKK